MNILIVDDEISVRKSLSYIILNELFVKCKVYTASSFEGAIKFAKKHQFELLITDICIGEVNGIELGKKMIELQPNCKIIFVSAYDEKEYLKAAISMKALGYIEKPIDKKELFKIIETFLNESESKVNHTGILDKMANDEQLISKLICGDNSSETEMLLNNSVLSDCSSFSVISFVGVDSLDAVTRNKLISLLQIDFYENEIKFILQTYRDFIVIAGVDKDVTMDTLKNAIIDIFEELDLNDRIISSIGIQKFNWKDISASYESSMYGINKGFFYGFGIYTAEQTTIEYSKINAYEIINKFTSVLEKQNETELINYVYLVIEELSKNSTVTRYDALQLIERFFYQMNIFAESNDICLGQQTRFDPDSCYLLESAKKQLIDVIELVFKEKRMTDVVVSKVKQYIADNYKKSDLSIKEIAENVHLNVSYLSTYFKSICGMTINNYLTEFRIEKAKKLVKTGKYTAEEIGALVGYEDGNYFYRIFKKQTGMTTKEYRKSVNK